ncbi:hypothetical protein SDJN03_08224, partial [Cucurbita argyrosperma subsp. sororia]
MSILISRPLTNAMAKRVQLPQLQPMKCLATVNRMIVIARDSVRNTLLTAENFQIFKGISVELVETPALKGGHFYSRGSGTCTFVSEDGPTNPTETADLAPCP